jgi:acyl-CoA thioesterase
MSKFERDTRVQEVEPGVFEGAVNRDWWIVLGPNGGFVAAQIVRAMAAAVGDDERTPRSLTIHYAAPPAEGPVRIRTAIERAGRSVTTVSARMEQGEQLIALALAAFSKPRNRAVEFDHLAAPDVPSPEALEPWPAQPELPPFSRQWEVRPAFGGAPFQEEREEAVTGGWIRPLDPHPIDGALVAQLADAWIPAVFQRLTAPNPVPTIDLTVHFRSELPLPADYALVRFESRLARGGYVEEDGLIWDREGRLIGQSRQLALLQGPSQD